MAGEFYQGKVIDTRIEEDGGAKKITGTILCVTKSKVYWNIEFDLSDNRHHVLSLTEGECVRFYLENINGKLYAQKIKSLGINNKEVESSIRLKAETDEILKHFVQGQQLSRQQKLAQQQYAQDYQYVQQNLLPKVPDSMYRPRRPHHMPISSAIAPNKNINNNNNTSLASIASVNGPLSPKIIKYISNRNVNVVHGINMRGIQENIYMNNYGLILTQSKSGHPSIVSGAPNIPQLPLVRDPSLRHNYNYTSTRNHGQSLPPASSTRGPSSVQATLSLLGRESNPNAPKPLSPPQSENKNNNGQSSTSSLQVNIGNDFKQDDIQNRDNASNASNSSNGNITHYDGDEDGDESKAINIGGDTTITFPSGMENENININYYYNYNPYINPTNLIPLILPQGQDWMINETMKQENGILFDTLQLVDNKASGDQIQLVLSKYALSNNQLSHIRQLSDLDKDGKMTLDEFCICNLLCQFAAQGKDIPPKLPLCYVPPSLREKYKSSQGGDNVSVNSTIHNNFLVVNQNNNQDENRHASSSSFASLEDIEKVMKRISKEFLSPIQETLKQNQQLIEQNKEVMKQNTECVNMLREMMLQRRPHEEIKSGINNKKVNQ